MRKSKSSPRGDDANELQLLDWRRSVAGLYADVRAEARPESAHSAWRERRDALFRAHPQSPLRPDDPLRADGLPYWPYDPGLRFDLVVSAPTATLHRSVPTERGSETRLRSIGSVRLPPPIDACLEVWWLEQYGGGIFLPIRDATAGSETYGGGRYLLDSVKGADLGSAMRHGATTLIVDLNFLYHPSCRYDPAWQCPLAPVENTLRVEIRAGERL